MDSRYLTFDESIDMLHLLYDMEVDRVSYSYTPLYGWTILLEGFNINIFRRRAEDAGLYLVHEHVGSINPGLILPASMWKRDDGKRMTNNLFGLDADNVDAVPLDLRLDGRTWKRLENALSKQMVKDFDEALGRGF